MYCVKFDVDNKPYFGFKYRGRELPQGLSQPEPRCAISKQSDAISLAKKYRRESSFDNIRVLEVKVK